MTTNRNSHQEDISQIINKHAMEQPRNAFLLNNRENLHNAPQMKISAKMQEQPKPLKAVRISKVNAAASAVTRITPEETA